MAFDILDAIAKIAPLLTGMAGASAANQNTNTNQATTEASLRPGIVSQNLRNSRLASMFSGYTPPKLNWGGPGSVAKGDIPTVTGGTSPDSADTTALMTQVQKDALAQSQNNYGLKDPSASSAESTALGTGASIASILAALSKFQKPGGGLPAVGGGPGGSSPSPGDSGFTGPVNSGSTVGGPGDLSNIDPNGYTARGGDDISNLLRLLGGIPAGGKELGPNAGSAGDAGYL